MSRLEELTEDFGVTLKHMAEQSYKPMTNGDRIRSMTDEGLADWLDYELGRCEWCNPDKIGADDCSEIDCTGCIVRWLKQPAEVDHDSY